MSKNYTRMTVRQNRRNRPETLLRLLLSTSYPHSTLADLMFAFSRHSGHDQEELDGIADEMTEVERQFGMTDFIRTVELLRNQDKITIVVRTLDFNAEGREIVDNNQTHVELARAVFHLDAKDAGLTNLDELAELLLGIFRKAQQDNVRTERKWRMRQRPTARGNAKLGNAEVLAVEEKVDHRMAVALVTASLVKPRFHIVLTHNTILLFDQQRSLK